MKMKPLLTCTSTYSTPVSDRIQYLLQVDVLIDDGLVPLRVQTLACVFGPPLVFSAGGKHYKQVHGVTYMQNPCSTMDHHNAGGREGGGGLTIYRSRAQCLQ